MNKQFVDRQAVRVDELCSPAADDDVPRDLRDFAGTFHDQASRRLHVAYVGSQKPDLFLVVIDQQPARYRHQADPSRRKLGSSVSVSPKRSATVLRQPSPTRGLMVVSDARIPASP